MAVILGGLCGSYNSPPMSLGTAGGGGLTIPRAEAAAVGPPMGRTSAGERRFGGDEMVNLPSFIAKLLLLVRAVSTLEAGPQGLCRPLVCQ